MILGDDNNDDVADDDEDNNALCVDPHCKVSIGQYTKMCTSPLIFFPAPLFQMTNI